MFINIDSIDFYAEEISIGLRRCCSMVCGSCFDLLSSCITIAAGLLADTGTVSIFLYYRSTYLVVLAYFTACSFHLGGWQMKLSGECESLMVATASRPTAAIVGCCYHESRC